MFDKSIEKIIHTRLYAFLETHNIPYEKQFGFGKNNSTIFALMQTSCPGHTEETVFKQTHLFLSVDAKGHNYANNSQNFVHKIPNTIALTQYKY